LSYITNGAYRTYFALVIGVDADGTTVDNQNVLLYRLISYESTSNIAATNAARIKLSEPITSETQIASPALNGENIPCIRYGDNNGNSSMSVYPKYIRLYNYALTPEQLITDYGLGPN
jgi:hypothetical protein